jgi:protein-tyrosine phosphatase
MEAGTRTKAGGDSDGDGDGDKRDPVRICFVCLGNICRSPTAEAVMKHLVLEEQRQAAGPGSETGVAIEVESAGTGAWHAGELRDRRSRALGERRGIPLAGRARQFTAADFERFDHVVAMDRQNLADLRALAPDAASRAKVTLLRAYEPAGPRAGAEADLDVPDPYHGGEDGFDRVFDICLSACRALLARIRQAQASSAPP